ncbi:hypothetical protein AB9F39_37060, partial [Rhizobium leguminosarum]
MRVDIGAEFYVRVKPDASSIALAAQTLGNRTNDADIDAHAVLGDKCIAFAAANLEEQCLQVHPGGRMEDRQDDRTA